MSLFQKSVEKKYLSELDSDLIDKKFAEFQDYFANAERQEIIRNSKEEQFQEGFLRELFVKIFEYTLRPEPNFNLTTELKNITNSKKADGAVLKGEDAIAVIELKGTDTTDLDSVETQAFGYKNHHPKCIYVITSNFEKLRFYIQNAVDHIDFDLFNLNREQFALMWLCLAKDNLLSDLPLKIKDSSVLQEENITKKLYADYSKFRQEIHQNLIQNNPETDKLLLFKKTQKLLDRFLFIFFAEDRLLVPANSITQIIEKWQDDVAFGDDKQLYDIFKQYFTVLYKGRPKSGNREAIFAYNGGLFEPDEILDNVSIDNEILHEHTLKLSKYDFETDVDVNILGHIFEHSLGEIENVQAEIKGEKVDAQKTKRKKDGIFYTPKYITKYIVENTVGKLCNEKRKELSIIDEEYSRGRKNRKKDSIKSLDEKLTAYRDWLLTLTILDPACGSGAFLNQALEFLIEEHKKIDELRAQLFGGAIIFSDITTDILEKNIYGVDLNEESVEIAKLSLWLRTAQKGRKLNTLSNNIKCGNSLIDDPEVAGEKAFNWQNEFPNIFHEKEKKAWHVTTATHNSRYSQRMFDNHVKRGEPVWLSDEEEKIVTETIAEIVEKDSLNVLAYNICGDHMHMVLVCEEDDVAKMVGKIKAMTARACNIAMDRTVPETRGHAPLLSDSSIASPKDRTRGETQTQLWTQKFGCKEISDEKQLWNTIEYIKNNRNKHELPQHGKAVISLIEENITCTYNHAFRTEYNGGFDVVIGNPPYVFAREKISENEKEFYTKKYNSADYQVNTYLLFIEKTVDIIKSHAIYGLIVPNAWLMVYSGQGLRKYLLENCKLHQIINLEGYSFEGVNVETIIILSEKQKVADNNLQVLLSKGKEFAFSHNRNQKDFSKNEGYEFKVFSDDDSISLTKKLRYGSVDLDSIVQIKAGLQAYEKGKGSPKQSAEDVKNRPYDYDYKFDQHTHKYLDGKDVGRYFLEWSGLYLKYGDHLAAPRTFNLFADKKIIVREITGKFSHSIISTYSEDLYLYNRSNIAIVEREEKNISLKYIVAVLNSTLMSYYFMKNTAKSVRKMFPKVILKDLRLFPFKVIDTDAQVPFVNIVNKMQELQYKLIETRQNLIDLLVSKFEIDKVANKLYAWYELDFKDFLKELGKAKIKLGLSEEAEWMQFFNDQKEKAQSIKTIIEKTDKEIDQMVYELYGLSEEEIKIVEGEK